MSQRSPPWVALSVVAIAAVDARLFAQQRIYWKEAPAPAKTLYGCSGAVPFGFAPLPACMVGCGWRYAGGYISALVVFDDDADGPHRLFALAVSSYHIEIEEEGMS